MATKPTIEQMQALQNEWAASPDAVAGDGVGSDLVRKLVR